MSGTSRQRHHTVVDEVDAVDSVDSLNEAAPETKTVSKRVKATPFSGGTTVIIRNSDFEKFGVEHAGVTWDYRINDFTVAVGEGITEEAANALVNNLPDSFKFL